MQYHLGMVYSKLKDKNNAAIHLKKAISLEPNSQTAKDAQAALARKRIDVDIIRCGPAVNFSRRPLISTAVPAAQQALTA